MLRRTERPGRLKTERMMARAISEPSRGHAILFSNSPAGLRLGRQRPFPVSPIYEASRGLLLALVVLKPTWKTPKGAEITP